MQKKFSSSVPQIPCDDKEKAALITRYVRVRGPGDPARLHDEIFVLFLGGNAEAARKIAALESLGSPTPQAKAPNVVRAGKAAVRFRDARRSRVTR